MLLLFRFSVMVTSQSDMACMLKKRIVLQLLRSPWSFYI